MYAPIRLKEKGFTMTIAYFDCFSGISGDMILGALVDAGLDINALRIELAKLNLRGYAISSERVVRSGLSATKVHVSLDKEEQPARRLEDIIKIIRISPLSTAVKNMSIEIFERLAEAEAKVHGTTKEHLHFHELGAVDAILDIVGASIGLEMLGVTKVVSSPINLGSGSLHTGHGRLPVPAPATAELLKGIPVYSSSIAFELTTPTGAAVISTLAKTFGPLPQIKSSGIGYGAGGKDLPGRPNVLRVFLGEDAPTYDEDPPVVIETNIDDMNPQVYDYLIDRLMKAGALDVFLVPVIMKKGRPAILLSVLTEKTNLDAALDIIFRETTSIGVRIHEVVRRRLSREVREVETTHGKVRVKLGRRGEEVLNSAPEYEDCRKIAEERRIPLKRIIEEAKAVYLTRHKK